jgi:hypothetical protein
VTDRKTYSGIIDRWRTEHGAKRVTHLERRHVKEHIAKAAKSAGRAQQKPAVDASGAVRLRFGQRMASA